MSAPSERFDDVVLEHLDDARRLARWLIGDHDADDVTQEALLRAFRYFSTFSGTNGRGWLLTIVRNTARGWYARKQRVIADEFDEELHSEGRSTPDPETLLLHAADARLVEDALQDVPDRFRTLLVLREFEGLSYQELADAMRLPIGTVMSRLSRGRAALRRALMKSGQRAVGVTDGNLTAGWSITQENIFRESSTCS